MKELSALQQDNGFTLLAISVDGKRQEQFMARTDGKTEFPALIGDTGAVSRAYRVALVPTIVILDEQRRIRYHKKGVPRLPELLRVIRKIKSG